VEDICRPNRWIDHFFM